MEAEAATLRRIRIPAPGCWPTESSGKASQLSGALAFPTMCRSIIPRSAKLPTSRALCPTRESSQSRRGVLGLGSYRSKRDEVFARWSSSIKALAARPNVFVKLGGLGQSYTSLRFDEDAEPPSSEMVAARFRPYIEHASQRFGTLALYV